MGIHLIDKAYETAKKNFNKTPFTFKELFQLLLKEDSSIKSEAIDLYVEILQDIRFISLGKQKWSLRENFKIDQINKITSSMFGLDEYHEEDADIYMSDAEKQEYQLKEEGVEEIELIDVEEDDTNITPMRKPTLSNDDEDLLEDEDELGKTIINSNDSDEIDSDDEDAEDIELDDENIE